MLALTGNQQRILLSSCVVDPHHIDADPDSPYHPDADPDSNFLFDADPDPDPNVKKRLEKC
jgi:hypothetical protein